jgi:hypothetical protein
VPPPLFSLNTLVLIRLVFSSHLSSCLITLTPVFSYCVPVCIDNINVLSRHQPTQGNEEDDSEDWAHNVLLLGTRLVSQLDTFATDMYCTDALVLSLEVSDDSDEDFIEHNCSCHTRVLTTLAAAWV